MASTNPLTCTALSMPSALAMHCLMPAQVSFYDSLGHKITPTSVVHDIASLANR